MQRDDKELVYKFKAWCYAYERYLEDMFTILNKYKEKSFYNIDPKKFAIFLFNNSSQYISPYAR